MQYSQKNADSFYEKDLMPFRVITAVSESSTIELGHFIRKVGCSKVQDAFSAVFDTLVQYDLNRDQIVFGVVAPGYLRLGEDVIIKPRACPEWGKFCTATTTNISQKTF